jgi:hypothetical protein
LPLAPPIHRDERAIGGELDTNLNYLGSSSFSFFSFSILRESVGEEPQAVQKYEASSSKLAATHHRGSRILRSKDVFIFDIS